jgi:hypothetical protein
MDELRPITEDDAAYPFAAFALLHPDQMVRGLWVALLAAWPTRKGPRPNYYDANHAAQAVDRLGARSDDIAAAWTIEPDSARKKVVEGRRRFDWQAVSKPSVEALTGDAGAAVLDAQPETIRDLPDDPAGADAWNETLLPTGYDETRSLRALRLATKAVRRAERRNGA